MRKSVAGSRKPIGTMSGKEERKVDLDSILVEEVGQFGRYQARVLALAALLVIFAAWGASEYVFTTARINTRCLIEQCDGGASPEFSPPWLLEAVPGSATGPDACARYGNATGGGEGGGGGGGGGERLCPADLFDQSVVVPCTDYVYQNTDTVVYDFGLACQEWRRSLIGSVRTLGTLTALPITGFISDRWGRRVALIFNAVNCAWLGLARYWADTYIGFMMSEVIESTFGSGGFSTAYILVMEVMGPKYRVAAGATMNTFFSIGQVSMGLIAWGVPNWRLLTLTLYIPMFITISYYWLMAESVRWYMSKGRYEESEAVLQYIAKTNRKELSPKSLAALRNTAEEEKKKKALDDLSKKDEPWLIVLVFRHKKILLRCAVSPVWWVTTTFIYYGMSINSVNLSGNRYVNYVAVSAAEIPGYWSAVYLMQRVGRRPVLMAAFWVCAACQIAYIFMPNDLYGASLAVFLVGKYSIAMVMTSVYVYTAELYPTKYRHSLFAFSSMIGRIGSIVAPLTPAFGDATFAEMPFVLFGAFALVSGLLILLTPETLGAPLPDSMQDAEEIGLRRRTDKAQAQPS